MGKRQKRNKNNAKKRKYKHEMRVNIRQIDELIELANIEDETWDAVVYKDLEQYTNSPDPSFFDKLVSYIYKSSTTNISEDSSEKK